MHIVFILKVVYHYKNKEQLTCSDDLCSCPVILLKGHLCTLGARSPKLLEKILLRLQYTFNTALGSYRLEMIIYYPISLISFSLF